MHATCLHVASDTVDWSAKSRSIVRDPDQAELCRCPCHLDCPLTDQITGHGWPDGCICNGTRGFFRLGERLRQQFDLREVITSSVDQSRRRSKARDELRARAGGLNGEQIEALIDEVWINHGLPVPSRPIRPKIVDRAMHPPNRFEELKANADVLYGMGKGVSNIVGMFRKVAQGQDIGEARAQVAFRIETGDDYVEVDLNGDAQPLLGAVTARAVWPVEALTPMVVSLRTRAGGGLEVWEWEPEPPGSISQLGSLTSEQRAPWLPYVLAAERVGQVAVCSAARASTPIQSWRMYVKVPHTPPKQ
jgi:hypothetical protein